MQEALSGDRDFEQAGFERSSGSEVEMDAAARAQLKALGYEDG